MDERTTTEPITSEEREYQYQSVSPTIQELYAGKTTGYVLRNVFTQCGLASELYPLFATVIGDVILGFYPRSDLKKVLTEEAGISADTAIKIDIDLEDLLSKIESTSTPLIPTSVNSVAPSEDQSKNPSVTWTQDPVTKTPTAIPRTTPQSAGAEGTFGAKPLTREEVLKALVPKRTMASDTASLTQQPPTTP